MAGRRAEDEHVLKTRKSNKAHCWGQPCRARELGAGWGVPWAPLDLARAAAGGVGVCLWLPPGASFNLKSAITSAWAKLF